MIQCLAFGDAYVDYFDEGTVELSTCGISEASNALVVPGPQEIGGDVLGSVVDYAFFFEDVGSPDTFADRIYRSLQRTLRAFPEAEGRICRTPDGAWAIRCCNHGVPFSRVLNFGLDLDAQRHKPAAQHLFDRVDGARVAGGDEPLLRVKLTLFGARGYCLAVSMSRALCDGHGLLALFARAWSSNERAAIFPVPSHDRDCVPSRPGRGADRRPPPRDVQVFVDALKPRPIPMATALARAWFGAATKISTLLRLKFSASDVMRFKQDTGGGAGSVLATADVLSSQIAHLVALCLPAPHADADCLAVYVDVDLREYASDPAAARKCFCGATATLKLASLPIAGAGAVERTALARDLRTATAQFAAYPEAVGSLRRAYDALPFAARLQGPCVVFEDWTRMPSADVGFNGETPASFGLGRSFWCDKAAEMTRTSTTRACVGYCAFSTNCEDTSGAGLYADVLLPTGAPDATAARIQRLARDPALHPLLRLKLAQEPIFLDVR